MKKIKILLVVGALVAVLGIAAACGNGDEPSAADASSAGDGPATAQEAAAPQAASDEGAPSPIGTPDVSALSSGSQETTAAPPPVGVPAVAPGTIAERSTGSTSAAPPSPAVAGVRSLAPSQGPLPALFASGRSTASLRLESGSGQAGIAVTGQGTVTLEPDLVLLNVGVETVAETVAEAREEAAVAMDAVVAALRAHDVEDRDIQTRFFNILPQYEFQEVVDLGRRTSKRVLVGYMVNNSASVKIRDLDAVGSIVDEVADAGGDAIRINGISFTVEDPKPFMTELREMAVADALATAQQFASLTGVSLGELVFIAETGGGAPRPVAFQEDFRFAAVAAAPAPASSISGGQLELRMTVQAIFNIQ